MRSGLSPKLLSNPFKALLHTLRRSSGVVSVGRAPSTAIVDTAPLRASTSCATSRLLDAREAISSSFAAIFSMVVKSHSDAAHITKRVVSRARP